MPSVTIQEAQAKLPELIRQLLPGDEMLILDNNEPVAKLTCQRPALRRRPGPGLGKGMMTIVADDEEHLKDFGEYMP